MKILCRMFGHKPLDVIVKNKIDNYYETITSCKCQRCNKRLGFYNNKWVELYELS